MYDLDNGAIRWPKRWSIRTVDKLFLELLAHLHAARPERRNHTGHDLCASQDGKASQGEGIQQGQACRVNAAVAGYWPDQSRNGRVTVSATFAAGRDRPTDRSTRATFHRQLPPTLHRLPPPSTACVCHPPLYPPWRWKHRRPVEAGPSLPPSPPTLKPAPALIVAFAAASMAWGLIEKLAGRAVEWFSGRYPLPLLFGIAPNRVWPHGHWASVHLLPRISLEAPSCLSLFEVMPPIGLAEPLPTMFRVSLCALATHRFHGAAV